MGALMRVRSVAQLGLLLLCSAWAVGSAVAQHRHWHDYFSYSLGIKLLPAGDGVLLVGPQSLYGYDYHGQTSRYSRVQGLAGSQIVDADYCASDRTLVVAYADGSVDVAGPGARYTVTELRDAQQGTVPLPIRHILRASDVTYAVTETHIVIINHAKRSISELLRVWPQHAAAALTLNGACLVGEQLYVATNGGIYTATGTPGAGQHYDLMGLKDQDVLRISSSNDGATLLAWIREGGTLSLKRFAGGQWSTLLAGIDGEAAWITSSGAHFVACNGQRIWRITKSGNTELLWDETTQPEEQRIHPMCAIAHETHGLMVASKTRGLIKVQGTSFNVLSPSSPSFTTAYRVAMMGDEPIFTGGGFNAEGDPLHRSFGVYSPGLDTRQGVDKLTPRPLDAGPIAVIDATASHYLVGTSNRGLLEMRGGDVIATHDEKNSPLQGGPGTGPTVSDALVTADGQWWLISPTSPAPLLHRATDGHWTELPLPDGVNAVAARLRLAPDGTLWVASPRGYRIAAIKPAEYIASGGSKGYGSQIVYTPPSNNAARPYDLAFDGQGQLWIATSRTLVWARNPGQLAQGEELTLNAITFPNPDWAGTGAQLLHDVRTSTLLVDAGDGVWVGGFDGNLHHVDPATKSLVRRYTPANSPLPGGRVYDLVYEAKRGMLYVASENGVVALKTSTLEGAANYDNVRVYPNPLRPEMPNEITIDGLVTNSTLKITDVSGTLVRELKSRGGRAVWDTLNGRGQPVRTGIYLIFASDEQGKKSCVEKVAIVR